MYPIVLLRTQKNTQEQVTNTLSKFEGPTLTSTTNGSWAARTHSNTPGSAPSPSSTRAEPLQSPWGSRTKDTPVVGIPSAHQPPAPSSNWRQHTSQSTRAVNRPVTQISAPNESKLSSNAPPWHSLSDFPAPRSLGTSNRAPVADIDPTISRPKPQLKGAWASRVKP